jgi:DNA-binding NarL/FixJ family response regulator
VQRRSAPYDVVVLDMDLKDPNGVTGGDLGIEIRQHWPVWPPEFLIVSGYMENPQYFKLALQLGAAAYIDKAGDTNFASVMRHVRVLALRRALSVERPDALERIRRIAITSRNQSEAVRRFCDGILRNELAQTLGAPFVLLLTDRSGTYCFNNRPNLPPQTEEGYNIVQALAQGKSGRSEPLLLQGDWAHYLARFEEAETLRRLAGAAFIPLASEENLRLSLGILPPDGQSKLPEQPKELARVMEEFFRPAVLTHLLTLTTTLAELTARRRAVLTATSQFCLYVGQEQLTTLEAAMETGEVAEKGSHLERLQLLAEDLCSAGAVLNELASRPEETGEGTVAGAVSMKAVAETAWRDVSRMLDGNDLQILRIEGDCEIYGRRDYLEIATARVLQWFIQRTLESPAKSAPAIWVTCHWSERGPEVVFQDKSRRLNNRLRERLFVPFSQAIPRLTKKMDLAGPGLHLPLYMAKTLVELGNWGCFEDRTAELDGDLGHRFVMQFPASLAAADA